MRSIAYISIPYLHYHSFLGSEHSACNGNCERDGNLDGNLDGNRDRNSLIAVVERNIVVGTSPTLVDLGVLPGTTRRHARQICPETVFVEHNAKVSAQLARAVWDICADYTPLVEPERLRLNTAFIDVTGCGDARFIVSEISRRALEETGLDLRIGISGTRLTAKAALPSLKAPESIAWVEPGSDADFLAPLPIHSLWPLGAPVLEHLSRLGISTVAQLKVVPLAELTCQLGEAGLEAHQLSLGIDHSQVHAAYPEESIRYSMHFEHPICDRYDLEQCLNICAGHIASELGQRCLHTSWIELSLEFAGGPEDPGESHLCTSTKKIAVRPPAESSSAILRALIRAAQGGQGSVLAPISSLSARASGLSKPVSMQLSMFDVGRENTEIDLARALNSIRERFGAQSVLTANTMVKSRRDRMIAAAML